jgi:CAI-1 autoinducer synthase
MQDPVLPEWFERRVDELLGRLAQHQPNPFAQPSNYDDFIALHQNDYLRLSQHPEVLAAKNEANKKIGTGSVASAVFGGDSGFHKSFQDLIKETMQVEDAILTTAGWTANAGLLESLTPADQPIYLDKEAHASLWSGAKLSAGRIVMVKHNDVNFLESRIKREGPGVVCIDSFYSTDGSVSDLKAYVELCERYGCLLVLDESHSYGMVGNKGGGQAVDLGLSNRIPFRVVSLSKALGGNGGFIAGSERNILFLRFRLQSVMFSSSPSETNSAGHAAAIEIVKREPDRPKRCMDMAALLRENFRALGIDPGDSACQIVSLYFDGAYTASKLYGAMREKGVLFSVFAPPAAPHDKSFARFTVHSETNPEEMAITAKMARECLDKLRLEPLVGKKSRPTV